MNWVSWRLELKYPRNYCIISVILKKRAADKCMDADRQKLQWCRRCYQAASLLLLYITPDYVINVSRRPHACARNETGWITVGNDGSRRRTPDVIAESGGVGKRKKRYASGHMQLTGWNWLRPTIWASAARWWSNAGSVWEFTAVTRLYQQQQQHYVGKMRQFHPPES